MSNPPSPSNKKGKTVEDFINCECGLPVTKLTSKKDTSRGRQFWRCPQFNSNQCNFFRWAEEATPNGGSSVSSRDTAYHRSPSRKSRTPKKSPSAGSKESTITWPQLTSRSSSTKGYSTVLAFRPSKALDQDTAAEASPARRPHHNRHDASPQRTELLDRTVEPDADITKDILGFLQTNDVVLKASARLELRHILNTDVSIHQAKLRSLQGTISEFQRKVDELEALYCADISRNQACY